MGHFLLSFAGNYPCLAHNGIRGSSGLIEPPLALLLASEAEKNIATAKFFVF
jgi:hypothetical protein